MPVFTNLKFQLYETNLSKLASEANEVPVLLCKVIVGTGF